MDSKPPLRYFFENIRNYSNLDLDETDHFDDLKIFDTAFKTPIYRIRNDELAETLRILAQIFYRVKNVDSLKGYYDYCKSSTRSLITKENTVL